MWTKLRICLNFCFACLSCAEVLPSEKFGVGIQLVQPHKTALDVPMFKQLELGQSILICIPERVDHSRPLQVWGGGHQSHYTLDSALGGIAKHQTGHESGLFPLVRLLSVHSTNLLEHKPANVGQLVFGIHVTFRPVQQIYPIFSASHS